MGDLRPNNGGGSPPEDGGSHPGDLPDFPPEWGTIVIPDDASELDEEAAALRRELHDELERDARRSQIRRVFGVARTGAATEEVPTGVGVPLVIMAVAIMTTLLSLFVVTWDRRPGQPAPTNTHSVSNNGSLSGTGDAAFTPLVDLTFVDATGQRLRLGSLLPAVILLVDACLCTDLVLETAKAVPAGVRVLAVGRTAPNLAAAPVSVHGLADPDGILRARHAAGVSAMASAATALLVKAGGLVIAMRPVVRTAEEIRADLGKLVD